MWEIMMAMQNMMNVITLKVLLLYKMKIEKLFWIIQSIIYNHSYCKKSNCVYYENVHEVYCLKCRKVMRYYKTFESEMKKKNCNK